MEFLIARRYQVLSLLVFVSAIALFQTRITTFDHPIDPDPNWATVWPSNVIGIDLGRAYSRVGIFRCDSFEIIPDEHGRTKIPNYVGFLDSQGRLPLVGFDAKEQATRNLKQTIYDLQLLLDSNFSDPEFQQAIAKLNYDVQNLNRSLGIRIGREENSVSYTPEEIQASLLGKLKTMADTYLNTTVTHAVIAVPSDFNDNQIQAINNSATLSGLTILRLVNESVAIGIAYHVDTRPCDGEIEKFECTYIIYEGTENESHLRLLRTDRGLFETLGTVRVETTLVNSLGRPSTPDQALLQEPNTIQEKEAKQIYNMVKQLLDNAHVAKEAVDGIIITSDFPNISKIQAALQAYFPHKEILSPRELGFIHNQAIVCGAAKQGYAFSDAAQQCISSFLDISPLSLGIELSNGSFLRVINRNNVFPTRKVRLLSAFTPGNQEIEKVVIRVFEGEREIASENRPLGILEFELVGVSADLLEREKQKLRISFELDPDQILKVTANLDDGLEVGRLVVPVKWFRYKVSEIEDIVLVGERLHDEDMKLLVDAKLRVPNGVVEWTQSERSDHTSEPTRIRRWSAWLYALLL